MTSMKVKEYLFGRSNNIKPEKFISKYEFKRFGQKEFGILLKKNLEIPVTSISL